MDSYSKSGPTVDGNLMEQGWEQEEHSGAFSFHILLFKASHQVSGHIE
jgi:hypothetical protein